MTAGEADRLRLEKHLRRGLRLPAGQLGEPRHAPPEGPREVRPYVRLLGFDDAFRGPVGETPRDGTVVPVHVHGREALVGPVVPAQPGTGPCFHCVAVRWQALRPAAERDVLELRGATVHAAGPGPHLTDFARDAVLHLAQHALDAHHHRSAGRPSTGRPSLGRSLAPVHRLRLDTLAVERHLLLADPDCPYCAPGRDDAPSEPGAFTFRLRSRPKPHPEADRLVPATEALPPWAADALANPVCGALGARTRPDRTATTTAPVGGRTALRAAPHLFDVHWSGHADRYRESAALALCEGAERHAGLRRARPAARVVGSRAELPYSSVDPRVCGLPGDAFHEDAPDRFVRYDDTLSLPWVRGWSLRDARPTLVPEQMVHYRVPAEGPVFLSETSNGCASGTCAEEAVLHGLLEVIERDAFLVSWLGRAALPEISAASCPDAATGHLVDRVRRAGYRIRLFDNRIDLPVPVVTAVATAHDPDAPGALCLSSAAHFDPGRAVASAVREVASHLSGFAARTARDRERLLPMAADFGLVTELADHAALYGLPEMARHADFLLGPDRARPLDETCRDWTEQRPRHPDLADDVRYLRDLLGARGFDTVVVDQTGAEQRALGLSTVKVLVPGMLPIDFGSSRQRAPGMPRARTALRRAGLRSTDLDPLELNPAPHPFM